MSRLPAHARRPAAIAAGALLCVLAAVAPARGQGALSALQTDVDKLAARARPSVLTVVAQLPTGGTARRPVSTAPRLRVGSGVAVEENALITTASVVRGAERVFVRTSNGIEVEARVAGTDFILNVAYLRVPELRLPALPPVAARDPQPGDWVIALGTSYRREPTQSVGNIVYRHAEPGLVLFQLSNSAFPGNSGGPVLNARGELVGLVLGELSAAGEGAYERRPGANSCMLPLDHVRVAWEDLRRYGRVRHGWLGIASRAAFVQSEVQNDVRVPLGALVEAVSPRSPAARLGLQPGDLVVAFQGERVELPEGLGRWVTATRPGTTVEIVWVRNEIRHSGTIALGESPLAQPEWAVADAAPPVATGRDDRIGELEREIERLKGEIARLRTPVGTQR